MAGELEAIVRRMLTAFEQLDVDGVLRTVTGDAQGVDEISRRWLRGTDELRAYMSQLTGMITDVRSQVSDVHEAQWGDTGVVTCWMEQDYTLQGQSLHVSAPTTAVLRRGDDGWRIALFHSIPLPEGDSS